MPSIVNNHAAEDLYIGALRDWKFVEGAQTELGSEEFVNFANFWLLAVHIYVGVLKAKRENLWQLKEPLLFSSHREQARMTFLLLRAIANPKLAVITDDLFEDRL